MTAWHLGPLLVVLGCAGGAGPEGEGMTAYSRASMQTADASGTYGSPHAFIGPRGVAAWENYRKGVDVHLPPYAPVSLEEAGVPGRWRYVGIRQGCIVPNGGVPASTWDGGYVGGGSDVGVCTFRSPGLWVGRSHARASPFNARVSLISAREEGGKVANLDLRVGFAEHHAEGGGAGFDAFVSGHGGDDGEQDLYMPNWGVDGVSLNFAVYPGNPKWRFSVSTANLIAATSSLGTGTPDQTRTNYRDAVTISGATLLSDGNYELGDAPTTAPLPLRWEMSRQEASTVLRVYVGSATLSWTLDNGTTQRGLHEPGNPDGVPYQNGSLDLDHLVPVVFFGILRGSEVEPLPASSMELQVQGTVPELSAVAPLTLAGEPLSGTVTLRDEAGATVAQPARVCIRASDVAATLPETLTFTSADVGTRSFSSVLRTPGLNTLTACDEEFDSIATTAPVLVAAPSVKLRARCGESLTYAPEGIEAARAAELEPSLSLLSAGEGMEGVSVSGTTLSWEVPMQQGGMRQVVLGLSVENRSVEQTVDIEVACGLRTDAGCGCGAQSGGGAALVGIVLAWLSRMRRPRLNLTRFKKNSDR